MAEGRIGANFSIDVTNLKAGLAQANRLIRESETEFKSAAAGMDDWTKSEDGLTAKIHSLNSITDIQRKKVDALTAQYEDLIADGLDPTSREAVELRTKINQEEAALKSNEKELQRQENALKDVGKGADTAGDKFSKLGDIAKAAGKVAATALASAGAAVGALLKQSIEGYAEYEQLVGGVETLFGAGGQNLKEYAASVGKTVGQAEDEYDRLMKAQNMMLENANNAYKTAGMSANEYITNVTGFSAALISSLGGDTVKAAEAADRALRDISDNANKMGTDMQSIVDTYQSLAKGNFQMLDNLKLGYGGTKTEMERLIADAAKMTDIQGELNLTVQEGDMSFGNMVNAISVIQSKMGIMGTTAKEAGSTIQGSIGMMKAAWSNLVAGIADENANVDQLITNMIDSIGAVAENLLPRVTVAIDGLLKMVEGLLPQIPPLIAEFLPVLIEGVMGLLDGVVEILPTVVDTIMEVIPQLTTALIGMLPTLLTTMADIVIQIINSVANMIPTIVDAIMKVLPLLISAMVRAIPQLIDASINLLMAIVEAIPTIITELTAQLPNIIETIILTLMAAIPKLIDGAIQLFNAILEAIPVIITALTEQLPNVIQAIIYSLVYAIPQLVQGAIQLFMAILDAIPVIIDALLENLPTIIDAIISGLLQGINALIQGAITLFTAIIQAIPEFLPQLIAAIPEIIMTIVNAIIDNIPMIIDVGGQIVEGLWEGIKNMGSWLWDQVSGFFGGVVDGICDFLGIASPSKLFENLIGKNMALGIGEGFTDEMKSVNKQIQNAIQVDDIGINARVLGGIADANATNAKSNESVVVYQTNNYSQAHSRFEIYKSKQQTMAAVQLALAGV